MANNSYGAWKRVHNRMRRKVRVIFQEAFGERGEGMCNWRNMFAFQKTVESAFAKDLGKNKAAEFAAYVANWRVECAIMAAIQLYPERFTAKELQQAIEWVLRIVPYDTGWAAEILGYSVKEHLHDGYGAEVKRRKKANATRSRRRAAEAKAKQGGSTAASKTSRLRSR